MIDITSFSVRNVCRFEMQNEKCIPICMKPFDYHNGKFTTIFNVRCEQPYSIINIISRNYNACKHGYIFDMNIILVYFLKKKKNTAVLLY